MPVELNHTIVSASEPSVSAGFMADILGFVVTTSNDVSLDFLKADDAITPQHYAFLLSEEEFDEVFGRITSLGLDHWADPGKRQPGAINHNDGGRGVYFEDPDGHILEIITRPYGSGSA
jgi:catechol 2,3-dioxygenase-like lactoylglutathione lyase family enzyme